MSSTRRSRAGAPLSQERFMSSEEYADLRGIKGMPTATKAALLRSPELRQLLFWLQQKSLEPGGLAEIAAELVTAFPGNVGTVSMREKRFKPEALISAEDFAWIETECRFTSPKELEDHTWRTFGDGLDGGDLPAGGSGNDTQTSGSNSRPPVPGAEVLKYVRRSVVEKLPDYLVQLCINPFIQLELTGEDSLEAYEGAAFKQLGGLNEVEEFRKAQINQFHDLVPCLVDLMRREREAARRRHALTSAGRKIWSVLDFCLRTGELVVIQGREGIGKTEAVKAWCAAHAGQVRYVSLASTNSRSKFFREIARACGVGSSYGYKSSEMEARVVDFLRRSKQMLIVDEGHYLIPQSQRANVRPELLDFLYSALHNSGVPVAVACTPQFSFLATNVERRTGWNADQFLRRAKRFLELPERLELADLRLVARALLPEGTETMIKIVAAFGNLKEHQLDALKDLVREARFIAEEDGRAQIKNADLERAMKEVIEPTLLAKVRAMGRLKAGSRPAPKPHPASPLRNPCNVAELPLPRGAVKPSGRGMTPVGNEAEEEFADAPALAG